MDTGTDQLRDLHMFTETRGLDRSPFAFTLDAREPPTSQGPTIRRLPHPLPTLRRLFHPVAPTTISPCAASSVSYSSRLAWAPHVREPCPPHLLPQNSNLGSHATLVSTGRARRSGAIRGLTRSHFKFRYQTRHCNLLVTYLRSPSASSGKRKVVSGGCVLNRPAPSREGTPLSKSHRWTPAACQ